MKTIKREVYKLRLRISSNTLSNLSNLEEWQWLNHQEINDLQQNRLTHMLRYAYEHVPYYRETLRIDDLIQENGLVDMNHFSKIQPLTKDIIRTQFEQLKSKRLGQMKWYKNTSGGSTGEPVIFLQHKEVKEWEQSVKLLFDTWSGKVIGDKQVRLWGSERDLLVGTENLKTEFGKWIRNERYLNTFSMTDETMGQYVDIINTYQPVQILAYVESIFELAKYIEENRLEVFSPRSIMTSAGTLFPYMREVIERVFKAPVFNRYGSREVGDIACECEYHEGLHLSAATHYVEILKEDGTVAGPGEAGEIVITSLMNYGMPLIRYKIGDTGIWAKNHCPCGRGLPLIKEVTGRVTDTFLTKEKKPINGVYFEQLFYYQDWIKKFQIVQEDYDLIRVSIVLKNQNIENPFKTFGVEIKKITKEYQQVMGIDCQVHVEFVKKIDSTASGKYRYIISKVKR